jgi:hypothetical protein
MISQLYFLLECKILVTVGASDIRKLCQILPPEERSGPLNIAGFSITVLVSEAQAGGYEIFNQIEREGIGRGPYLHQWDK